MPGRKGNVERWVAPKEEKKEFRAGRREGIMKGGIYAKFLKSIG